MSNLLVFEGVADGVGDSVRAQNEYENRFHDLVNGSLQGIMVTCGSAILFANDSLARMLGYSSEELLRLSTWEDLLAPDDRQRVAAYCTARDSGEAAPDRYEYKARRKDGTLIWLENMSRRVLWDGAPAVQATVIDITERKLVEIKLRDSERRSQEFAADVAHELRTPLAVLGMRLDSMADLPDVQALKEDVDTMARLVEQLLTLARLDRLVIDMDAEVDLRAACVDAATLLAPLIVGKQMTVEVEGSDTPVYVNGDHACLSQAVINLVENACKHSSTGDTITIAVGPGARVSVIDHGPGVALAVRERIFQRQQQADVNTIGLGLGLHIVRRIVEAHGGGVELSDTPGGGATFTLELN